MKAVGFKQSHSLDHPEALLDLALPTPEPGPRDLQVEVRAVSVNPVDQWIRISSRPEAGEPIVLGMDAAGIVRVTGAEVSLFKPGDRVWYSGSFQRQGSSSELHASRRTPRRAHAGKYVVCRGRRFAADCDHRLGTAL